MTLFLLAIQTFIAWLATPSQFWCKATPLLGYCVMPFRYTVISFILSAEQTRAENKVDCTVASDLSKNQAVKYVSVEIIA